MPLSFDLSAVNVPQSVPQRRTPFGEPVILKQTFKQQQQFTFSFQPAASTLKNTLVKAIDVRAEADECKEVDRGDDEINDQYVIPPNRSLCVAVLCRNETGKQHPRSVLGDHGHLERSSAWLHLIGGLIFILYTGFRQFLDRPATVANHLVTLACGTTGLAFLFSTVYHVTSPNQKMAYYTRLLDYFGIYLAISIGGICDTAIATRGFENVATISIVDAPVAALVTFIFFTVRRLTTSSDESWKSYFQECTITFGMFRKSHVDLDHASTRQSTSFVICSAYFTSIPQLLRVFEPGSVAVVVSLQAVSFLIIVCGMLWDNLLLWPDKLIARGRGPALLSSRSLGCACSSHAWWHLLAVVASVWSVASREAALLL